MLRKRLQPCLIFILAASLPAQTFSTAADPAIPHNYVNTNLLRSPALSPFKTAFFPQTQTPQQPAAAATAAQPQSNKPGWARRHLLLFTGLALTGGGAALVAGGGPGQGTGCLQAGPYGQFECATVSTWGLSGRHLAGLGLLCVGVPVAIVGIFKHP